jgi:hypothetical protein
VREILHDAKEARAGSYGRASANENLDNWWMNMLYTHKYDNNRIKQKP